MEQNQKERSGDETERIKKLAAIVIAAKAKSNGKYMPDYIRDKIATVTARYIIKYKDLLNDPKKMSVTITNDILDNNKRDEENLDTLEGQAAYFIRDHALNHFPSINDDGVIKKGRFPYIGPWKGMNERIEEIITENLVEIKKALGMEESRRETVGAEKSIFLVGVNSEPRHGLLHSINKQQSDRSKVV